MELAVLLVGIALFGFGPLLGVVLLPWGSLGHRQAPVTAAVLILASMGVAIILIHSIGVYRHGPDGGWWPLIAAIYSAAWALILSIALGVFKLFGLRQRSARNEA